MQFGKIFAKKLPFFQSGWQLPFDIFQMRDPSSWILGQFSAQQLTLSLTPGSVTPMVFRSG